MSIISVEKLSNELPIDASNSDGLLKSAIDRASYFVKAHTNNRYDPWDDYDSTTGEAKAPKEIEFICTQVAIAMYMISKGIVVNDEYGRNINQENLEQYKKDLRTIDVAPVVLTQTVSLNSDYNMLIGERVNNVWTRVIPERTHVESAASNTWVQGVHWVVRKSKGSNDEYPNAWYLDASDSNLEGTLHYTKTYRSDALNYMRV